MSKKSNWLIKLLRLKNNLVNRERQRNKRKLKRRKSLIMKKKTTNHNLRKIKRSLSMRMRVKMMMRTSFSKKLKKDFNNTKKRRGLIDAIIERTIDLTKKDKPMNNKMIKTKEM
jgi:hypothetical protein